MSDWFMDKGYSHKMCEDYVVTGDSFVIVSDGCSSSKHTDIGSRVLCMATKELLTRMPNPTPEFLRTYILGRAYSIIQTLGLPIECLDATLLVASKHGDQLTIYAFGDGYIGICMKDGRREFYKFEFPRNAPYYPSYQLDPERNKVYMAEVGMSYSTFHKLSLDAKWERGSQRIDAPYIHNLVWQNGLCPISAVILATDGIGSFIDNSKGTADPIPDVDILSQLTNFKMVQGEFIRRRANAALKLFTKSGMSHYDDLTIGGLSLE